MNSQERTPKTDDDPHLERRMRRIALGASAIFLVTSLVGYSLWQNNQPSPTDGGKTTERQVSREYPRHENIIATEFWVGEAASEDNDQIHNVSSAWMENWVAAYGGVDDPTKLCDYRPCDFKNKENSFYLALPFGDMTETGPKTVEQLSVVPWFDGSPLKANVSILKNRWVEVMSDVNGTKKVAYAQWEDVGPFGEDDAGYVFGDKRPSEPRAGIDLSPATAQYLDIDGRGMVSWRFVDEKDVPDGPWTEVITRSAPQF